MKGTQEKKTEKIGKAIEKIAQGKKDGLEDFYKIYGDMILLTAMSVCRVKDKAEEVVNTVLTKIWNLAKSLQEREVTEGWLYILTLNCAKNKLNEKKTELLSENIPSPNDFIQKMIDDDSFFFMIRCLPEAGQELMMDKFVRNMTFEEIAEEMEKPLSTVTSMYYRALTKIKENFKKYF